MNFFQKAYMRFFQPTQYKQAMKNDVLKKVKGGLKSRLTSKIKRHVLGGIAEWHIAVNAARSTGGGRDYDRVRLYEQYDVVALDSAVISEVEKVKNNITMTPYNIYRDGQVDEKAKSFFQKRWMTEYLAYMLDGEMWGHSLVQVVETVEQDGVTQIKEIDLIPRENVRPEKGLIALNYTDSDGQAVPYRDAMRQNYLIEYGGRYNLGAYLTLVEEKIYKKYARTDWATLSERFGQPFIAVMTDSDDEKELEEKADMAQNFGSSGWAVLSKEDEIKLIEPKSSDTYKVYKEQILLSDNYISRVITGQTMTSDSGENGSRALGEVQERTEMKHIIGRLTRFQNHINEDLIPLLIAIGYPLEGCKWEYDLPEPEKKGKGNEGANPQKNPMKEVQQSEGGCCEKKNVADDVIFLQAEEDDTFFPIFEKAGKALPNTPKSQINQDLYESITGELFQSWRDGAGGQYKRGFTTTSSYNVKGVSLYNRIRANVHAFSGAKSLAQMNELRDFMIEGDTVKPWTEVRQKAIEINHKYNVVWLETERNAMISTGIAGAKWNRIQNDMDAYPYLRIDTAGDARVRKAHAEMDGITLKADDPFWLSYYPPYRGRDTYGCRCSVTQVTDNDLQKNGWTLSDSQGSIEKASKLIPEKSRGNCGIDMVLDPASYETGINMMMLGVENYGMKKWERINNTKLSTLNVEDEATFQEIWEQLATDNDVDADGYFIISEKDTGACVRLSNDLKQDMQEYDRIAGALKGLFSAPDEVWWGEGEYQYIQYYKDAPVLGIVSEDGTALTVRIESDIDTFRKGVLISRK